MTNISKQKRAILPDLNTQEILTFYRMGSRIPNPIRNRVAQQWVMGVSRDIIAKDN